MTTNTIQTQQLFSSLDKVWDELLLHVASIKQNDINLIPFINSWTAAQLITHIKKSNKAIIQALQMEGKISERNINERVEELKNTFLDFNVKFQSPEFLIPEKAPYKKEEILEQFEKSINELTRLRNVINLSEIINLPIFGEITKLEILYFVLYHTQRHICQLKNILYIINNRN